MAIAAAYADPVHDAQRAFRAVMNALARPGTIAPIAGLVAAPAPLSPVAAALALALADFETTVFLDGPLAAAEDVRAYLTFHSGARLSSDPSQAAFAVIADPLRLAPLTDFALGTDAYPDRSTTLILQVPGFAEGRTFKLEGPGIKGSATLNVAGLPGDIVDRLTGNRAAFPRGVDLVLAGPNGVAGLPRTTRVSEA
jgi:alpha-D-ribose 1-methylphosphonate 5-triphosphate synthase subunit PhnH